MFFSTCTRRMVYNVCCEQKPVSPVQTVPVYNTDRDDILLYPCVDKALVYMDFGLRDYN